MFVHCAFSLREAVHDEAVRPKMQCLMMDPSFSMVTVQGEDSGIEWETTPSRCTTPWGSEAGNTTLEFSPPAMLRSVTPGSVPAGRIIFVMDEEQILKRKKSKGSGRRSRAEKPKEPPLEDFDEVSGRPELVGVSLPNVKVEREGEAEEASDPLEDKEQLLFRLVSEGSEILNIVVNLQLATVDEEESTVMVDNLSYLEETLVIKSKEENNDDVFEPSDEVAISTHAPAGSGRGKQVEGSHLISPNMMDPPGAPVTRPLTGRATGNVDYFEKFTLIDAQAPGSPAVAKEGQEEEQTEEDGEIQDSAEPEQPKGKSTPVTVTVDKGTTVAINGDEIASELLDEVFYGGMDNLLKGSQERGEECKVDGRMSPRSPLKKSGSALFGSQEDILTPIFLPEGPLKIIDPILLEEPKAMAFLYTDLYEEAIGTRQKDEDAESMTSEKSFHSRHSDREARGYLEKYVLKDETPVVEVEVEPADKENSQVGGVRIFSQDTYSDFLPSPEQGDVPATEEEITDFFRSSANSSPCDMEPFPPSPEEENVTQSKKQCKAKENKSDAKIAVPQTQVQQPCKATQKETIDPLSVSSYKPLSALSGGEIEQDLTEDVQTLKPLPLSEKTNEGMPKPVAPPRRKAASAPKTSLDLTPLTPVEATEEGEECGGKEQREEEKEKASPTETADEGEGDGEETGQASSIVALSKDVPALITELTEASETEIVQGEDTYTETVDGETKSAQAEGNDIEPLKEERRKTETGEKQGETGPEMSNSQLADSAKTDVEPEKGGDCGRESVEMGASKSPPAAVTEPAKESGRCIIL